MSKSNAEKAAILDRETGKNPAATRYIALFTVSPSDSGGGTEVTGGSYARKSTVAADWNAASTTTGTTSNATAITFAQATANWGTVSHWAIMDAVTGGNLLRWGELTTPKVVNSGSTARFPIGSLSLTETGSGSTSNNPLNPISQWRKKLGTVSGTDVFYDGDTANTSAYIANQIAKERAAGQGPWVATRYSSGFTWIVPPDAPLRKVNIRTDISASWRKPLQNIFDAVPIPDGVYTTYDPVNALGLDSQLCLYQPSTDRMWEIFWYRTKNGPGASGTLPGGDPDWLEAPYFTGADTNAYASCHWGGATLNASKNIGVYDLHSWPPWSRPNWGGSAGSHLFNAGLITQAELQAGVIPHAIACDGGKMRAGIITHPAFRTDGLGFDQWGYKYGSHFRIAPEVNLDGITFATPFAKMIAKAMQDYGLIMRNQTGGAFTIFCEDPRPSGNPFAFTLADGSYNPTGYFEGMAPPAALDGIPWSSLIQIEGWDHQTPGTTYQVRGDLMDYTKQKFLEHMVGKTSWTKPTSVYAALFTGAPRHDQPVALGSPNFITIEVPSTNNYSRVQVSAANWDVATATGLNVYIQNNTAITFPTPTGSWGTPEAIGIYDAATGGNLLAFGWIPAGQRVARTAANPLTIPIAGLNFQDLAVSTYLNAP